MFGKKKKEVVDENTFHLDKDSMQMGKPDQKPPISVMKFIKRKLIFLLVFIIIVAGVLAFLVYRTNHPKTTSDVDNVQNIVSTDNTTEDKKEYKYTDKNDWYYNNPIKFKRKTLEDKKYLINYFEIDGLSNSSLQKSINENMLSFEKQLYEELSKKYPHVEKIEFDTYVMGNFANIFSVEITENIYTSTGQILFGRHYYTINLIDGKKVNFEDVVDNNELKPILLKYGYLDLAKNYVDFNDTTGDEKFANDRAGALEEDVYQFVNDVLNSSSKVTMGIASGNIFFSYPNNDEEVYTTQIGVPLGEINKKEYIYNRYVAQNIYNNNYEKVGPFPVYMGNSANIINVIYEKGDNYFINIIVDDWDTTYNENNDDFWAKTYDILRKMANESISKADKDKSRFYYLTAHVQANADKNDNIGRAYANILRNNYLTKEAFDNQIYNNFLIKAQEFNFEGMCKGYIESPDVGNPESLYHFWNIDFSGNIIDQKEDIRR